MTETPPESAPAPEPKAAESSQDLRVVVRAYPKVIFFWLTWIFSLVAGIIAAASANPEGIEELPKHLGTIWMLIFAFNLIVISFDFNEVVSVMVVALIAVVVLAGLQFGYLGFIEKFLVNLRLEMNSNFYFTVFGLFTIIYLVVFIKTRFDFWEFRYNEVIHRRGVFADIKRYSTEDLRWFKEIPDVLERLLAGSGRMIITTPREQHPIVIQHVLRIGKIDEKVADILGTKRVVVKT